MDKSYRYILVFSLLIILPISSHAVPLIKNQLEGHASPYLSMHGADPVAWQEWNNDTVSRAKKEGKLLFVSSGYFSCHWCHVMQRESFKNDGIALILNRSFIPVKVDREVNSALDSRLIEFVERTQGQAGWPLNVFVTPEGYPLVGMTYVPTNNFLLILQNLKDKWSSDKAQLENIAKQATQELSNEITSQKSGAYTTDSKKLLTGFLAQASDMMDELSGGFGDQNKFPSYPQLNVLLKAYSIEPNEKLKEFLLLTLNKMASQGLNDQLSGGFYRYSVDPTWQIPHFEKMLYDNALLASLYLDAANVFNNNYFSTVARKTLDYLLGSFISKEGAFIASLSAVDNNNIEGGYYLWKKDELKSLLNKSEYKFVTLFWHVQGVSELEDGHHLIEAMDISDVAKMMKISKDKANDLHQSVTAKLLQARSNRVVPEDDKLLAAWNGLALSAFSKAAKQFNDKRYYKAANNIKEYIYKNLWRNQELVTAVKNNKILAKAGLEDYAYVMQGMYNWLSLENNKKDKLWLNQLTEQAWNKFYSVNGWKLAENMLLKYGEGEKVIADGVMPSASAVVIDITLNQLNLDNSLRAKAKQALYLEHNEVVYQSFWYASHIAAIYKNQNAIK